MDNICCPRWRILKTGVRLHSAADVDDIWRTCCAFHNWLLEADGLNENWEQGVHVSDYLGDMGLHDGAGRFVPAVFARAANPRTYDYSGMGSGGDVEYDEACTAAATAEGTADARAPTLQEAAAPICVKDMSQSAFRRKLIEHFSILWNRGEITWPSRTGVVEWGL